MPDIRLLRDLQLLDRGLTSASDRIRVIDIRLNDRSELTELETQIFKTKASNEKLFVLYRDLELKSMSLKGKAKKVEGKLYGGSVYNPRELQDLAQELRGLNKDIGLLDEQILEIMLNMDVVQHETVENEKQLSEISVTWAKEHKSLVEEKQQLTSEMSRLTGQREKMIKNINPKGLIIYERLRMLKVDRPVAEVISNICGVCRVTLPTHHVQLAKGGKDPILCTSCGRILYAF